MLNKELYKRNRSFISSNLPSFNFDFTKLKGNDENFSVDFVGEEVFIKKGKMKCGLHSKFDVENEIKLSMSKIQKNVNVLIVFGLGLGHIVNYLLDHKASFKEIEKVIIFEPSAEVFDRALYNFDLGRFSSRFINVDLIIGIDQLNIDAKLNECLFNLAAKNIDIAYNITYRNLFSELYDYISGSIVSWIRTIRSNVITTYAFNTMWIENCLNNIFQVNAPVSLFDGFFQDKPVLLISAGPSLNDMVNFIKGNEENFYIAAVGSAIGIVNTHGIVPDFYYGLDGSPEQELVFKDVSQKPILIYSDTLYSKVVRNYEGPKLSMYVNSDQFNNYILEKMGIDTKYTWGSASIALFAMSSLVDMGFKSIYMIGQDLAYSQGKMYSQGAWKTGELQLDEVETGLIKTIDKFGKDIYSDVSLMNMKQGIEAIIKKHRSLGVSFYNLGKTGLAIKGATEGEYKDILDFAHKAGMLDKVQKRNEMIERINHYDRNLDKGLMREIVDGIKADVDDIASVSEKLLSRINDPKCSEEKIVKESELYSKYLSGKTVYSKVLLKMLRPTYFSVDSIYNNKQVRFSQTLKIAETMRLCLITSKVIDEIFQRLEKENSNVRN